MTKQKRLKVKSGPEVVARVNELRQHNAMVREALRRFENKKRTPKIEDSFALTNMADTYPSGLARVQGGALFLDASFRQDELTTNSDNFNVDLLFIPALSIDGEWQGTVVETVSADDAFGSFIGQYVADIVMVEPDPSIYSWDVVYEEGFWFDGTSSVYTEPGMYATFELGTSRFDQQLDQGPVSRNVTPKVGRRVVSFERISLLQTTGQCQARGMYAGSDVEFRCNQRAMLGAVRRWGRCTFHGCAASAVGCGLASIWSAGATLGPCFTNGCATSAGYCAVLGFFNYGNPD